MAPASSPRHALHRITAALVVLAALAAPRFAREIAAAASITVVAPTGASAGVVVQITGTGFDPTASRNTVTLTPASGPAVTVPADTIATVDATKGVRRIGFTVPAGLPIGAAAIKVTNTVTGDVAQGRTLDIIDLSLPATRSGARGTQQLAVQIAGTPNTQFVAGRTTPNFGSGITVTGVQVQSPTLLTATISISSSATLGLRTVLVATSVQTAQHAGAFTVVDPNRAPSFTSVAPTAAVEGQALSYQATASDADGDSLTFRLLTGPAGAATTAAGLVTWTPGAAQVGTQRLSLEVSDGRGGTAVQTFDVTVAAAPKLDALHVAPHDMRFADLGSVSLTVSGHRTDGVTVDVTAGSSGTSYESSNPFVARVDADGKVTAVANGTATIATRNAGLVDTAVVLVELGVTLQRLELSPSSATLRAAGARQSLSLRGFYSDGSTRDLTAGSGVTYDSSQSAAATVSPAGEVVAVDTGDATITARLDGVSATAAIAVRLSNGAGFLRGEIFDDRTGLPLAGATVTLLADGGGAVITPVSIAADDRGRFTIAGRAGEAVVAIAKNGYTSVERRAAIPANGSAVLLDARLMPRDPRATFVRSALGGDVRDSSGRLRLQVPAGAVAGDVQLSVTGISGQGLAGRLPVGWSPAFAVDVAPGDVAFAFPASLEVPNTVTLPPGATPVLVKYDRGTHDWRVAGVAHVDASALTVRADVTVAGQFAIVLPDLAGSIPPAAVEGDLLRGAALAAAFPAGGTASGEVIPRSAPPGDDVRALGRVAVTGVSVPSGTVVLVRVNEQFDLLDRSTVLTEPFTQDIVVYQQPAPRDGRAGATFPITPSRQFSIQQLLLGVVRLDVTAPDAAPADSIVDGSGGSATDSDGDTLTIAGGALSGPTPVHVRRLAPADIASFAIAATELLGAVHVDTGGASLSVPAALSLAVPNTAAGQVFVGRAFSDRTGRRRLRLVGVADVVNGRATIRTTVGAVTFAGVAGEGDYVFVRASQPLGFITGLVQGGAGPLGGALVTSDTAVFADVTDAAGHFIVAGVAAVDTRVRAADPASFDAAEAIVQVPGANQSIAAALALSAPALAVLTTAPAGGALNVALDASVSIDFTLPLDAASATEASVMLQKDGVVVPGQRVISADGKRITIRPGAPLAGRSTYTLVLTTGLHDRSGRSLTGFTPFSFSTVDPSRPSSPAPGQITAALPGDDGIVIVTGTAGAVAGGSAVSITNLRTAETVTIIALADGSFTQRIAALVGDELALGFRTADGRDGSFSITQYTGPDGAISVGPAGGTIPGAGGRKGSILPRALSVPGVFRITAAAAPNGPALPAGFRYVDAFALDTGSAAFTELASLALTDAQGRFAAQTTADAPFSATGTLTVPGDALLNSALTFAATVSDASGRRRTTTGSTTVVGSSPDGALVDAAQAAEFPSVFVSAPRQAVPNQQITVSGIAPEARVDLTLPRTTSIQSADTLLLTQVLNVGDEDRLLVVDRLVAGADELRTNARDLPGARGSGEYRVVAAATALAFADGVAAGPPALIAVDGSPFVFRTTGPNGRFTVPVAAGQPFTLRVLDGTGTVRGTITGNAPQSGSVDVGDPLASTARYAVTVAPDEQSVADIGTPITFRFSEPIDARTFSAALFVTDPNGSRVFGRVVVADDARSAAFTPLRRWRYGSTYRYTIAASALARSGARLPAAVVGSFTTFRPSTLATLPLTGVRDVALNGSTGVVATEGGLTAFDIGSPRNPLAGPDTVIPGGAASVAILAGVPITDRTGHTLTGPFVIAGTGGNAAPGTIDVFGLATKTAMARIGSTRVSPNGATAQRINVTESGAALAALGTPGAVAIAPAQSIPPDSSSPGRAITAQHAATPLVDIVAVADRVAAVGAAGLTVLDGSTLAKTGTATTSGSPRALATAVSFASDANGDGVVGEDETGDLAVVANGADGTLQMFRLPVDGDPALLSVVRLSGEAVGVAIDASERLAYVSLAVRGVAVVDLDGPASIQPLDADHDGLDDRILGLLDVGGRADRVALVAARGLGVVADGTAGVRVLQLKPPRATFLTLLRDPVKAVDGDEQELEAADPIYTTDDALRLTVDALQPSTEPLVLRIADRASGVSFADGSAATTLVDGLNEIELRIDHQVPGARSLPLQIVTTAGRVLTEHAIAIQVPDLGEAVVEEVRVGPTGRTLTAANPSVQLGVAAFLDDGRVFNVTADGDTTYDARPTAVAAVSSSGLVNASAGGTASIVARTRAGVGSVVVRVDQPPVLASLSIPTPLLTVRALGEAITPQYAAAYSDGSVVTDVSRISGLTLSSSAENVATVDASGRITATGPGTARVTARAGVIEATVDVTVDPRTPPSIASIALDVPSGAVSLDQAPVFGTVALTGTGSLDGLTVAIVVDRNGVSSSESVTTGVDGRAGFRIDDGARSGPVAISASVVDPSTGAPRTASASVTLLPAAGDLEGNDDPAHAASLPPERKVNGTVGGNGDTHDMFKVDSGLEGALEISLRLPPDTSATAVTVVVRDANGNELGRFTPTGAGSQTVPIVPGAAFIDVIGNGVPVQYSLSARVVQADVSIGSVSPMAGPPGTTVTIAGSGFSTRPAENLVLFSGMPADVLGASATQLVVRVPANAVNGSVEVISGSRSAQVQGFATGNAAPRPAAFVTDANPAFVRIMPTTGEIVDINRVVAIAGNGTSRADVTTIVAGLGGSVVGYIPVANEFVLEFPGIRTFDGLAQIMRQLGAVPGIARVLLSRYVLTDSAPSAIDSENSGGWNDGDPNAASNPARSAALSQIRLFDAVRLVREGGPFAERTAMRDVRVAVIDSGFNPDAAPQEFKRDDGSFFVEFLVKNGSYAATTQFREVGDAHGTQVTSVIAARNDGNTILSGVLNSFVDKTEAPFPVSVYQHERGFSGISESSQIAALNHIQQRGDIDVVNISSGGYVTGSCTDSQMQPAIAALRARTLIVASAGNDSVEARCHFPAAFESTEPNVVSVGGVAVAKLDGTAEGADARFLSFAPTANSVPSSVPGCRDTPVVPSSSFGLPTHKPVAGSNCGPGVTIAAPGEDVFALADVANGGYTIRPHQVGNLTLPPGFGGTSASAPIVTGVAAILQAIRPDANRRFSPAELRSILTRTADDISVPWHTGNQPMVRLNALAAVASVLPNERHNTVFIADSAGPSGLSLPGLVVAVDVDSLTGTPLATPATARTAIPLKVRKRGIVLEAGEPRGIVASTTGTQVYVYASSAGTLGDGIVVLDSRTRQTTDFIPLSGGTFPPNPRIPATAFKSFQPHIPMVLSPDGRLLYVAAGASLKVINTVNHTLVTHFSQLPAPFNRFARFFAAGAMNTRLHQLETTFFSAGPPGVQFGHVVALEMSRDGRRLLVLVGNGAGSGVQPGAIVTVNVDLFKQIPSAGTPGGLTNYLKPDGPVLVQTRTTPGSDEPFGMALSANGEQLYVANGGVLAFGPPNQTTTARQVYAFTLARQSSVAAVDPNLVDNIETQLDAGATILNAPGVIDVVQTNQTTPGSGVRPAQTPTTSDRQGFISDVNTAWKPSATEGGAVISPLKFGAVYAKRPAGIAVRPFGGRAIVPYFQTGNFGVLDSDSQPKFAGAPPAGPFVGVAGVTEAVQLDANLWPSRGVFLTEDGLIESPDERLLFPSEIHYSQNGEFAAAIHTGARPFRQFTTLLPPFTEKVRRALTQLGFTLTSSGQAAIEPDTQRVVQENSTLTIERGGGAVSFINDRALTLDLRAHAGVKVPSIVDGVQRSYYSQYPVCAVGPPPGVNDNCQLSAVTTIFDYPSLSGTGTTAFYRPTSLAITAPLMLSAPLFGDAVTDASPIHVSWSNAAINELEYSIFPLDSVTRVADLQSVGSPLKIPVNATVSSDDRTIGQFTGLQPDTTYRLVVVARAGASGTSAGIEISRTFVDFTYVR